MEIIIRLVEELLSVERGFLNLSHCSQQHAQYLSFFNEWSVCCSLLQCVTDYLPDPDSQKLQCRYQQNGWESLIPIAASDQSEFPFFTLKYSEKEYRSEYIKSFIIPSDSKEPIKFVKLHVLGLASFTEFLYLFLVPPVHYYKIILLLILGKFFQYEIVNTH